MTENNSLAREINGMGFWGSILSQNRIPKQNCGGKKNEKSAALGSCPLPNQQEGGSHVVTGWARGAEQQLVSRPLPGQPGPRKQHHRFKVEQRERAAAALCKHLLDFRERGPLSK